VADTACADGGRQCRHARVAGVEQVERYHDRQDVEPAPYDRLREGEADRQRPLAGAGQPEADLGAAQPGLDHDVAKRRDRLAEPSTQRRIRCGEPGSHHR
jgi:hypothetical protein